MSRNWERWLSSLAKQTGYSYNYLLDRFNEVMEEDGDLKYFIDVTYERDW